MHEWRGQRGWKKCRICGDEEQGALYLKKKEREGEKKINHQTSACNQQCIGNN